MTTLVAAVPIVPARDVAATARWYADTLGFAIGHVEGAYGIVARDGVEVHFWGPSGIEPEDSVTMYRLGVRGIGELHEQCRAAGIVHPGGQLGRRPWGSVEFSVRDCDGNLVTFFERAAP